VTIYGITIKFSIRICLYPTFQCTKFQGNWIIHLCFATTFIPWWKEEEKNEETKPIFEGLYLGNTWCNLVKIWNVRWWHWPAFLLQKSFCFVKVSRSYAYVKIALLFFLLITHGFGAPASWAARHTTVCLDTCTCTHFLGNNFRKPGTRLQPVSYYFELKGGMSHSYMNEN